MYKSNAFKTKKCKVKGLFKRIMSIRKVWHLFLCKLFCDKLWDGSAKQVKIHRRNYL